MLILLKRILGLGWNNVSRNAGLSFVAVFAIVATLLLAVFVFTVNDFSEMIVDNVKDKISISVYFKDGVDEKTIQEVKESVLLLEETKSVEYTSKEEAFEIFIERYKNNPTVMASLAEVGNPFLSSLSIKSGSPEGYEIIADHLHQSPLMIFFEKIDYEQRKLTIESVFAITTKAQKVGFAFAVILAVIAVLIVFNTIRLAIYSMKDEIKIMRLVGVSDGFIRGLFIMQGAIIGVLSFTLSFAIVFGCGMLFGGKVDNLIDGIYLFEYLKANFLVILLLQLLLGLGLGIISSFISAVKHLKD